MSNLESTIGGLQNEEAPKGLGSEFATKDKPFYVTGIIRASYTAGANNYEFRTEDVPTKSNTANRNLNIVGEATKNDGSGTYNVSGRITYPATLLTEEGQRAAASALKKKKGTATKAEISAGMSLGKLSDLVKAIQVGTNNPTFRLQPNGEGWDVAPLIDVAVDFEMRRGDNGYNNITRIFPKGSKARKKTV